MWPNQSLMENFNFCAMLFVRESHKGERKKSAAGIDRIKIFADK